MKFSHPGKYCHIVAVPMSWVPRANVLQAVSCNPLHALAPFNAFWYCAPIHCHCHCHCHSQSHCWYQTLYPMTSMRGKNQTQNRTRLNTRTRIMALLPGGGGAGA